MRSPLSVAHELIMLSRRAGRKNLTEEAAKRVLRAFGVPVPNLTVLRQNDDVEKMLEGLRPPFALKVIAPGILHKSEVGGVRLNLVNATEIRTAMYQMQKTGAIASQATDGFLLEEMAPRGHELVLGGRVHEHFGPIVMLGLGGIFVEVLADVTFRLCPVAELDAEEMLDEVRGRPVLEGARGGIIANKRKIIEVLMQVGGEDGLMCTLADQIADLDINPLIVDASQALAVDARILLA